MPDQVPPKVRKVRNAAYRAAFERSAEDYRMRFIGRRMAVLWESTTQVDDDGWQMAGLTDNYVRVTASAPRPIWNEFSNVLLQAAEMDRLTGSILA